MALDDALSMSKVCVQISDDVAGLKYFDVVRVVLSDSECNKAMQGARVVRCSFMDRMRALDLPRCEGCYPVPGQSRCLKMPAFTCSGLETSVFLLRQKHSFKGKSFSETFTQFWQPTRRVLELEVAPYACVLALAF